MFGEYTLAIITKTPRDQWVEIIIPLNVNCIYHAMIPLPYRSIASEGSQERVDI